MLEVLFTVGSAPRLYSKDPRPAECNVPCGGEVEYLSRGPVSRTRLRKGNPVPGVITGSPPCKTRDLALQVGGASNLR
jgi:hypothetical protein